MNSVGIIGFGRFGKVLANLLKKGFQVKVFDNNSNVYLPGTQFVDKKTILSEKTIFVAVPIRNFESVIKEISNDLFEGQTIIDVCSVKMYPINIMKKHLPNNINIIGTHPMFGPDSFESNSKLKMMLNNVRSNVKIFQFWKQYFNDQKIQILEMSPNEHDILAAKSQGITHFLGRTLKEFGINKTSLDTQGFRDLLDLVDQTCNDSLELFKDLQCFNPHTKEMINKLMKATKTIEKELNKN
tara:strand:- start:86986 stop:87708 length:723 start_codon:yes stop_codon:yes gene_type:complete